MAKRTVMSFAALMFGMFLTILAVYGVSNGEWLAAAAVQQQTCRVMVASTRGTVYDCGLRPLTGDGAEEYAAAVVPSVGASAKLNGIFTPAQMRQIYPLLTGGKPFALKLPVKLQAEGIDVFTVRGRYSDAQPAVHIIGYLDASGNGVSGVEKAFNSQLSGNQGRITVSYPVDALNRVLSQDRRDVSDTTSLQKSGVVLTLDRGIQQLAEKAADRYLQKGAVVIVSVPDCKIRAMVSRPSFSPNNVAAAMQSQDSPLLNRALSSYSVGSVFKLVAATSALEYGISPDETYECTGAITVDGGVFHCFDSEKHGKENMKEAIADSCNTYFVDLMQKVPQAQFLLTAQTFGFGRSYEIAPGIRSDSGVLPTFKSLKVPRALANFSFGQGDLTANPLQIAAMVNAIASGGEFTQPSLYAGTVDENLKIAVSAPAQKSMRVMTAHTAALLREFMKASIDAGTSRKGKPTYGDAGAKTATAQTGKYVGGKESVESWFAGFYPYENPQYAVVVFAEGGDGGGTTCGPAFQEIADGLFEILREKPAG